MLRGIEQAGDISCRRQSLHWRWGLPSSPNEKESGAALRSYLSVCRSAYYIDMKWYPLLEDVLRVITSVVESRMI